MRVQFSVTCFLIKLATSTVALLILSTSGLRAESHDAMSRIEWLLELDIKQLSQVQVSAQKRDQFLVEVPLSMYVLSGEQLANEHYFSLEQIQWLSPSVTYGKGGTTRNSSLILRGVGTVSFSVGVEPSVSTVVDGVPLARSGQAFTDLLDVDRIEILRGPQGTLFGKNASSGVIHIISKKPTDDSHNTLGYSITSQGAQRAHLVSNGPLRSDLNYRLAASWVDFDGYAENSFLNEDINGQAHHSARLQLQYEPTDKLSINLHYDLFDSKDDCCAKFFVIDDESPHVEAIREAGGEVSGLSTRRSALDYKQITEDESEAFSVTVDYQFDDTVLTSISGWREWFNLETQDLDNSPVSPMVEADPNSPEAVSIVDIGPQTWRQASQELRLQSQKQEGRHWLLGLFAWHTEVDRSFSRFTRYCVDDPDNDFGGQNFSTGGLQPGDDCPVNNIVTPFGVSSLATEFKNYAVFGQISQLITEQLSLTFGARYTRDELSFVHQRERFGDEYLDLTGNQNGNPNDDSDDGLPGILADKPRTQGSVKENNFSSRLALDYAFNKQTMGYISYSQGYKGPAFNVIFNMKESDGDTPIEPETSDSFEVGLKWRLQQAHFQAAVFKTDYENFQANNFLSVAGTIITNLGNVGPASTEGMELQWAYQPFNRFFMRGGVALANAELKSSGCNQNTCVNRAGEDLQFAPKLNGNLELEYSITAQWAKLIFKQSIHFQSEMYGTDREDESARIPGYTLWNSSVRMLFQENYAVTLFAKNLFDQSFYTTRRESWGRFAQESDLYLGAHLQARF